MLSEVTYLNGWYWTTFNPVRQARVPVRAVYWADHKRATVLGECAACVLVNVGLELNTSYNPCVHFILPGLLYSIYQRSVFACK